MNKITKIRARADSAARGVMLALPILASIGTGLAIAESNPPSQIISYLERVAFTAPNVPQTADSTIKKAGSEYDLWCNG
jgi:hypothetical protein